jgi:hypothetical protein
MDYFMTAYNNSRLHKSLTLFWFRLGGRNRTLKEYTNSQYARVLHGFAAPFCGLVDSLTSKLELNGLAFDICQEIKVGTLLFDPLTQALNTFSGNSQRIKALLQERAERLQTAQEIAEWCDTNSQRTIFATGEVWERNDLVGMRVLQMHEEGRHALKASFEAAQLIETLVKEASAKECTEALEKLLTSLGVSLKFQI